MRTRLSMDKVQLFAYFIVLPLLGSAVLSQPFAYASGIPVPYLDALFTAMSAVCVTGLSTVSMDVYSPAGFIVIMVLIEMGGLGIVTFISFYLAAPKRKLSLVNRTVVRDFFSEDVEIEPRRILLSIIGTTFIVELIGAVLLYGGFRGAGSEQPVLDAVFHSVSAFCNAGFSTRSDSLAGFVNDPWLPLAISLLIIAGGVGFSVLADVRKLFTKKLHRLTYHSQIVLIASGTLIFGAAAVFWLLERNRAFAGLPPLRQISAAFFQAVTPRTAGFETVSQANLTPASNLFTAVLMFIGGSPGSIAGGVKTTTFLVVFLYAIRGNTEQNGFNMRRKCIDTATVEKAFSIVAKSLMICMSACFLLLISERESLMAGTARIFDIFFETISAFATVGLSLGATASLSAAGKAIVIATMFIGRTGIFAMALGFAHSEKERYFEYPSASILIG